MSRKVWFRCCVIVIKMQCFLNTLRCSRLLFHSTGRLKKQFDILGKRRERERKKKSCRVCAVNMKLKVIKVGAQVANEIKWVWLLIKILVWERRLCGFGVLDEDLLTKWPRATEKSQAGCFTFLHTTSASFNCRNRMMCWVSGARAICVHVLQQERPRNKNTTSRHCCTKVNYRQLSASLLGKLCEKYKDYRLFMRGNRF